MATAKSTDDGNLVASPNDSRLGSLLLGGTETNETKIRYSVDTDIKLANGKTIPAIQLGVYEMSEKETRKAVGWALEAGYRGIDSASLYDNEQAAGPVIAAHQSHCPEQPPIHFTTKLSPYTPPPEVPSSIQTSLRLSSLPTISLYLIHSPHGGYAARLSTWHSICDAIDAGHIESGGVSNYGIRHLKELIQAKPKYLPVVNQIEMHPFNYRTRKELVEFCREHGILVQAYAPLTRGERLNNETLKHLATKKGCSVAQLLVRWSLQKGFCVLPKSVKKQRILENFDVANVHLGAEEMEELDQLDEGLCTDWNPLDVE